MSRPSPLPRKYTTVLLPSHFYPRPCTCRILHPFSNSSFFTAIFSLGTLVSEVHPHAHPAAGRSCRAILRLLHNHCLGGGHVRADREGVLKGRAHHLDGVDDAPLREVAANAGAETRQGRRSRMRNMKESSYE